MNFNKIFLFLSFAVVFVFNSFGMKTTEKSETEIMQKLIKKELNKECKNDDFSAEELDKSFTEAIKLCNKLQNNLSTYFKVWSKIARNPVFEYQLLKCIEDARKNLLLYKSSDGKKGVAVNKDKLKNVIALMKLYDKINQEVVDKSLSNNVAGKTKRFFGLIFWPVTTLYKSYLMRLVTEFSIFLAMCGFINGMYLSDNFIKGFAEPFVNVLGGIFYFLSSPNSGISCENQKGLAFATCQVVALRIRLVDWVTGFFV
jgi:hypothetical protein